MYLPHDKYLLMSFYAAWFCSDSVCSAWYSVSFWKVPCKHGSVLTFDPLYVYNISLLTDGFLGKRDHFLYLVWQFLFSPICRESHWCWQNATVCRLFLDFLYWKKKFGRGDEVDLLFHPLLWSVIFIPMSTFACDNIFPDCSFLSLYITT
jgi:hypothetical protein